MTDFLRTTLAPIPDAAWDEIRSMARRWLEGQLSARRFVDVDGPHGWDFSAVNLGKVRVPEGQSPKEVRWGLREVLPLIESRVDFDLSLWGLDDVARGAKNPDLSALFKATQQIARFEEQVIYNGFEPASVRGIVPSSPHKPIVTEDDPQALVEALEHAVVQIEKAGIGGPFGLATDEEVYTRLMAGAQNGYPIRQRVESFFEAGIRWSPAVSGAVVISARSGHYVLTLGQDVSIGYQSHDTRNVSLYLTESFTFRVLEPAAAAVVKLRR